jgi:prephenate dehydratase
MSTVAGYPGPAGSHTAAACLVLAPAGWSHEPYASFIAVVEAAVAAEVSMGVLPIENSLHGPVAETHDLLYEAPLSIVSEVTLPIVHCLVARQPIQPTEVKTLRSNPVAFDQCREFVHAGAPAASPRRRRRMPRARSRSPTTRPRRRSRPPRPRRASGST